MKFFTHAKHGKHAALFVAIVVVSISAIGAYAYFTSTGHGAGSGTVGTSTTWQVDTDAATGGPLTPGGGSGTWESIKYRVTNNSTGHQSLANVAVSVANSDGSAWTAGAGSTCDKNDFTVGTAAAGATWNDTVLAGDLAQGAVTADGTITLKMVNNGNQDDCKGVTVPLYLAAT